MAVMAANGELVVAGVRSTYLEVGDRDDRAAVVFVHGNPGPATDWSDLLERTGEFARGIAMDFPGYGTADRPRHFDYSVSGYARQPGGAARARRRSPACISSPTTSGGRGPWRGPRAIRRRCERHAHQHRRADRLPLAPGGLIGATWVLCSWWWPPPPPAWLFSAFKIRACAGRRWTRLREPSPAPRAEPSSGSTAPRRPKPSRRRAGPGRPGPPGSRHMGESDAYLPLEQAEALHDGHSRARGSSRCRTPGTGQCMSAPATCATSCSRSCASKQPGSHLA